MRLRVGFVLVAACSANLAAQHPNRTPPPAAATVAREASQFDFLVGQWELTVTPKVSGLAARIHGVPKLVGTWKGWKVLDGQGVEDELRIVDASGNPNAHLLSIRLWSIAERRWLVSAADGGRGRMTSATATFETAQMVVQGRSVDAAGKVTLSRSRFSGITPNAFTFVQDRSEDDGRTWDEGVLKISARRVAAVAPR
jgi:hypothetical protein